jgi:hypothetical protein
MHVTKYYQTEKCPFNFVYIIGPSPVPNKPVYEMHVYTDGTYDSYSGGHKFSSRKQISKEGLQLLREYVEDGYMTTNKSKSHCAIYHRGQTRPINNSSPLVAGSLVLPSSHSLDAEL